MEKHKRNKSIRENGVKLTDTLKTLCNFMKNISLEWDLDESKILTEWYLEQFFESLPDVDNDHISAEDRQNGVLLHTLSLWGDVYLLCPMIHDFNVKALEMAEDDFVFLLLPQLLFAIKATRDEKLFSLVSTRCNRDIRRCVRMFWILVVEVERDASYGGFIHKSIKNSADDHFFAKSLHIFMKQLRLEADETGEDLRKVLWKQGALVEKLVKISGTIRQSRVSIAEKKRMVKEIINKDPDLLLFDPAPLPVKSHIPVIGIIPDQCSVFQSQLNPMLLSFLTKDGKVLKCIFKSGDDLRQDAFMLQVIRAACEILRSNAFSIDNVVTYDVVPTGLQHGFVEFVASECLDNIFQREAGLGTILRDQSTGELDDAKMMRFIDSTAFYAIVTYLMCIGDRHLDNILLTDDGRLFHIDYGFIGREPKPFAPMMKLCPEIVDIMGGKFSGYYGTFMKRCINCFLVLRKNANVLLSMFELMMDAGIADINAGTLSKITSRFALDKSDSEAMTTLTGNIEKGFETVLPKMMDNFHHTWKVVNGGGAQKNTQKQQEQSPEELEDWLLLEETN